MFTFTISNGRILRHRHQLIRITTNQYKNMSLLYTSNLAIVENVMRIEHYTSHQMHNFLIIRCNWRLLIKRPTEHEVWLLSQFKRF